MEQALPFTKEECLQAKKNPSKDAFTQFVTDYVEQEQIDSTITRTVGEKYTPLIEDGEIKFE